MNRQRGATWLLVAVAVAVVAWYSAVRSVPGPPLDPDSTDPQGTRALTELLGRYGSVEVHRGPQPPTPGPDLATIVLLRDRMDVGERQALERWAQDGGRLVVTDPSSPLGRPFVGSVRNELASGSCDLPGLDGLVVEADSIGLTEAPPGDPACFTTDGAAFVVERGVGAGTIVSIGSALPLTNEFLDESDNAVVAVRTIEPVDGAVAVWFTDYAPGSDEARPTLFGLIPGRVRWMVLQLLVAVGLGLLVAGRRFGRVVDEPQLVELPGSLGIRAEAELHRRAGGREAAALALRRQAVARVRRHLGVRPDEPYGVVVERFAARGHPPELLDALNRPVPTDADGLRRLVADVDRLEAELDPALPRPAGSTR